MGYKAFGVEKTNLKEFSLGALENEMAALGHGGFRGRQLFRWIYKERATDFSAMTDLSKKFRAALNEKFTLPSLRVVETREGDDGTAKHLFELHDGYRVEGVFIPMEGRNTFCVSTQVGCKMACRFCATGYMKFGRNLKAWEIVEQLLSVSTPAPVTNLVLMGMGEPFDNYDEVVKALRIFQDPLGPQIGKRHITVSTVGITPKLQEFVDANLGKLAISLHGTTDAQRASIMPINRKHPLKELMDTCRKLKFKGQGRVTFEYVLLDGVNDSQDDAYRLVNLVRGLPCKINLLAYNENPFIAYKRPEESRILAFQRILLESDLTATYRRSRGRDIAGACGQLHAENTRRHAAKLASGESLQS